MKGDNATTFSDLDEAATIVWEATRKARSARLHDERAACTPLVDRDCDGACGRWVSQLTEVAVRRARATSSDRHGWRLMVAKEARRAADQVAVPRRRLRHSVVGSATPLEQRVLTAAVATSREGRVPYPVVVRRVAAAVELEPARVHHLLRRAARRSRRGH